MTGCGALSGSIQCIVPENMPHHSVMCGFTTRKGGVSPPPFDTLNFGRKTSDNPESVDENFQRFFRMLNIADSCAAFMGQVHGDTVRVVENGGMYPGTDSIVTAEAGLVLTVKTADCVPLILFDPVTMCSAAVHCGWRSLTSGIAEKTVSIMRRIFGATPENIIAASGPSAGPCCYEIGDDVARLLHSESVIARNGSVYADLRHELRIRLVDSGFEKRHIETIADCTICDGSRFFSHRRDGVSAGRMLGFIMIPHDFQ